MKYYIQVQVIFVFAMIFTIANCEISQGKSKDERNINIIADLRKQIRNKEMELENAEKTNKNYEKMIQLVNILGQVDTFLTERLKTLIKKMAVLADEEEYPRNKRSHKQ